MTKTMRLSLMRYGMRAGPHREGSDSPTIPRFPVMIHGCATIATFAAGSTSLRAFGVLREDPPHVKATAGDSKSGSFFEQALSDRKTALWQRGGLGFKLTSPMPLPVCKIVRLSRRVSIAQAPPKVDSRCGGCPSPYALS